MEAISTQLSRFGGWEGKRAGAASTGDREGDRAEGHEGQRSGVMEHWAQVDGEVGWAWEGKGLRSEPAEDAHCSMVRALACEGEANRKLGLRMTFFSGRQVLLREGMNRAEGDDETLQRREQHIGASEKQECQAPSVRFSVAPLEGCQATNRPPGGGVCGSSRIPSALAPGRKKARKRLSGPQRLSSRLPTDVGQ